MVLTIPGSKRMRASFARELEYIREDALESDIDDRIECLCKHSHADEDDYRDCVKVIDAMDSIDDTEDDEIERLLKADRDMSFEQMISGVPDLNSQPSRGICPECGNECGDCTCKKSPVEVEADDDDIPDEPDNDDADDSSNNDSVEVEADDIEANMGDSKDDEKALESLNKDASEAEAKLESVLERDLKYIDMLESAASYLYSLAPSWDVELSESEILGELTIENVIENNGITILTLEPKLGFFDNRAISISKDTEGKINTVF